MLKRLLVSIILWLAMPVLKAQVNFTSSNLPVFVINTHGQYIPDEPKITADLGVINNGAGKRNNLGDAFNEYNGKVGIEMRGQSSQGFPMNSYTIELRNDTGAEVKTTLLGMPEESDWVLYAPYTDKTLMHNFLAYTFSASLGHWAPRCRFVEVMLNNQYIGVYVCMEKIKRDKNRVDIKKLESPDIAGDALTGGYIFSIDKEANAWFSPYHPNNNPNAYLQYSYVYPKPEDIVAPQQQYIQQYVDSFENALAGPTFQSPATGFRKYADENSFIDYLIVNEISRNVDGYRLSSYFHKDQSSINGKIVAGPVWDYDLAFRNADYCDGSLTHGWAYNFNQVCPGDYYQMPFWWQRFMQDTTFQANLYCRWQQVRQTVLSNTRIFAIIDSAYNVVQEAQQRHFTQWPILGQYVWPNPQPIPTSYDGEISTLKTWLTQRLSWLDDNMPKTGICVNWPATNKGTIILKIPNPVINFYLGNIQSKQSQTLYVRVIDMLGRVVYANTMQAQAGANAFPGAAGLNSLQTGIYFIQIISETGEKVVMKVLR
ncbi:CotH kinase family protein [Limnovirga soli]|uniref:T9SS type A sorting domain-containing protein n=1 Tax=Limnovirga soli TaxID=2656915 RepID=A0A8J8FFY5_9BACT|nr:CotH kinase family protein [Limnovirga soli]NNV56228.1 T9SS type A sorting domain-containing protein [Limnovirga soli]